MSKRLDRLNRHAIGILCCQLLVTFLFLIGEAEKRAGENFHPSQELWNRFEALGGVSALFFSSILLWILFYMLFQLIKYIYKAIRTTLQK